MKTDGTAVYYPFSCIFMITIDPVQPQDAMVLKDVRLRALKDTPSAFGSTYAREVAFEDEKWIERATPLERGLTFLARDAGDVCGLVGGFIDREDATLIHVVSMWVAPTHRRLGVGQKLVEAVVAWAKKRSVKTVRLCVTNNNAGAIQFYKRIGFEMTKNTIPYPNDPNLFEYEMIRDIIGS